MEQLAPAFERFGVGHEAEGGASLQGRSRLAGVLSSSVGAWQTWPMKRDTLSYHGYRGTVKLSKIWPVLRKDSAGSETENQ